MTSVEALSQSAVEDMPMALKRWTIADYRRMTELHLLDPGERTELLNGHITLMVAKGTAHVLSLRLVSKLFESLLAEEAIFVSTQDPIVLNDFSEPEPDLAIVRGAFSDYATQHPRPEQIALIVEIADSTVKRDREIKGTLCATAGISDYWVLDLPNRQLHLFREPLESGYGQHRILDETQQVSPLMFPDCQIEVSLILPDKA